MRLNILQVNTRNQLHKMMACLIAAVLMVSAAGCSAVQDDSASSDDTAYDLSTVYTLSASDLRENYDDRDIMDIDLKDGETRTIRDSGVYCISGSQSGQIRVDVQDEIVTLILMDAYLHSYNGPAICVDSAAKVIINVPEGTSSVVTDTSAYEGFSDRKACIDSNSDLTINGGGSLQVSGYHKDAIRTKDVLKILNVELTVNAKGDGLRGNDGVVLEDATLKIQCEGDGIYTKRADKPDRGYVAMNGGDIQIVSGMYGVRSAENLYIQDCSASIYGVVSDIACQGRSYIQEGCLQ